MNNNQFVLKLYGFATVFLLFGLFIGYKLFHIQFVDGEKYRQLAEDNTLKYSTVKPQRGNIYSFDGSLLATSTVMYDVYFDSKTVKKNLFDSQVYNLSKKLAKLKSSNHDLVRKSLISARNSGNRYFSIIKNIDKVNVDSIKSFPIFKYGSIKGGLIIEKKIKREFPLGKVAERTIGYERIDENGNYRGVGLEHAFGKYLRGQDGYMLKRKISNGQWKTLDNELKREPINGFDIITTIDSEIQDIVHDYLLEQTEKYEANHSSAIVMEVETGDIKAISNFGLTENGKYYEKLNYAIGEGIEPGSTFKLIAIAAALEDQVIDTIQKVDTSGGILDFYGYKVRDSRKGGYGKINVMDAIRLSSNTGVVKIIDSVYNKKSKKFVDRLYNFGIAKTVISSIKGEPSPIIPHPNDESWNGLSLPWMTYGYGVKMTPMQILTFYNSIANDGEVVKPKFIHSTRKFGTNENKVYPKQILNKSIFSNYTNKVLKKMLYDVVHHQNGTAKNIKSKHLKLSGKTGTTQVDYITDTINYISSFVGYFPSDKPKYSCIIVLNKPNKSKGFYGNKVAAPVFKRIAEKIFSKYPEVEEYDLNELNENIRFSKIEIKNSSSQNKIVSNGT